MTILRFRAVADAIRNEVEAGESLVHDDIGGVSVAVEGRLLTRLHQVRERDRGIVEKRKASALKRYGRLVCEVCDFDFAERYGSRGAGFIECHHVRPVHSLAATGEQTSEDDLALVCANCHRMIHASQPWLTTDELRQQIRTEGR